MESADITRLMSNVRIHVPGALDDVLKLELFNVLTDFFQSSNIWQEKVALAVTPEVTVYDVTPTDPGQINRLMWVVNGNASPVRASMETPGTLSLARAPATPDIYTVCMALTVTDPVDTDGYPQFPAWVMSKYGLDLAEGVIGKLMSQPKKPYTNASLAIFHLKKLQAATSQARSESRHQNIYGGQRWSFPQAFATRRRR